MVVKFVCVSLPVDFRHYVFVVVVPNEHRKKKKKCLIKKNLSFAVQKFDFALAVFLVIYQTVSTFYGTAFYDKTEIPKIVKDLFLPRKKLSNVS